LLFATRTHKFAPYRYRQFSGAESVLLAAGILGATVMPHVIFLHSSLTQDRIVVDSLVLRRRFYRFGGERVLSGITGR
jgi:Mn2+/Fe2+ NRAMP family transporter